MKTCKKCDSAKPLSEFIKHKEGKFGVRPECKVCTAAFKKQRYPQYRDKILADSKKWAQNNREKRKAICKKHYYTHLEQEQARSNKYAAQHPAVKREQCARRRAAKALRTPTWLSDLQHEHIKLFYEAATALSIETGGVFEVDHVIPLNGKTVSGLHVPWNLQVITQRDNRAKGNKMTKYKETK